MNRKSILLVALVTLLLTGCAMGKRGPEYQLPSDPVELHEQIYTNPNAVDDYYLSLEYKGRIYVCYGNLDVTNWGSIDRTCVGYLLSENSDDDGNRVLTLGDTKDYIMTYYVNGVMEQPRFYRAVDTVGQAIYTPSYISMVNEYNSLWDYVEQSDWDHMNDTVKSFMKLSGLNLSTAKIQDTVDTYGFHGDGYKVYTLDLMNQNPGEVLQNSKHWTALPLSENMEGFLAACTYKDGTDAIPDNLQNGYYFYYNRYETCQDRYDEEEGFSESSVNFTAGVWDADANRFYVITFDT